MLSEVYSVVGHNELTAYRDGLRYAASYESLEFYEPPRSDTYVAVHIFEGRQKELSCGSEERAALAEFAHYGGKELDDKRLEAFLRPGKG